MPDEPVCFHLNLSRELCQQCLYTLTHSEVKLDEPIRFHLNSFRELSRQCLYTLISFGSHAENIPCTLPLLFESKARNACTLSLIRKLGWKIPRTIPRSLESHAGEPPVCFHLFIFES